MKFAVDAHKFIRITYSDEEILSGSFKVLGWLASTKNMQRLFT